MRIGLLVLLAVLQIGASVYTLYRHPIESGARCLDGSPAAIFYSVGSEANRNKFMIYFNSGGLCTGATVADTLEDCYKRSFTSLGSSVNYADTRSFPGKGLLSDSPSDNPVFFDWTKVYVPYCDGSEHQGSRETPVAYKGRDLYFRGANNSMQQFEYLNRTFGLYSADKIVLTGVSAGGIATYAWSNYLYDRSLNKQVFSLPDSGLFVIDYISPFTHRANVIDATSSLIKIINNEVPFPIAQCGEEYKDNEVMCFSAGLLAKYLKTSFFIIESQYDQWSMENILGLSCTGKTPGTMTNCNASEIEAMEGYRIATLQAIRNLTSVKNVGVWSPTCIQHGFTDAGSFADSNYRIPSGTGITLAEAIQAFLDNPSGNHIYIDDFGWPANKGCSGVQSIPLSE